MRELRQLSFSLAMRWMEEEEVETGSLGWATLKCACLGAFELASVSATEFTRHEEAF